MEYNKRKFKLFILAGKARSGKDSAYEFIKEYYQDKKVINISFGYYIKDYIKRITNWNGSDETKPRELLQSFGIDLVKNKIDSKLFIKRIFEDIEIFSYFYDIIVITDARLLDEIELVKEKYQDSISIRIERNIENGLTEVEKQHITETELDNYNKFDYVVKNDEFFKENIIKILEDVNE